MAVESDMVEEYFNEAFGVSQGAADGRFAVDRFAPVDVYQPS